MQYFSQRSPHQWFVQRKKKRTLTCQNELLRVPKFFRAKMNLSSVVFSRTFFALSFWFTFCFKDAAFFFLLFLSDIRNLHQLEDDRKMLEFYICCSVSLLWTFQIDNWICRLFCAIKTSTKTMTTAMTMAKTVTIVFKGIYWWGDTTLSHGTGAPVL